MMRARKEVYRVSSRLRHRLDNQDRWEPRSADDVLPLAASVPHHH